jgi:hypothetical protein
MCVVYGNVEDYHGIDYKSNTVHCSTAQHSTAAQCCLLQFNAVQCNRVQLCTIVLFSIRYLIAYSGMYIVIYSTGHISSAKYSYALYSLICEISQVFLQGALEVSKRAPFHHIAAVCNLLFAFLFIAFCSSSIQVYKGVPQKIMTHCIVIRNKINR